MDIKQEIYKKIVLLSGADTVGLDGYRHTWYNGVKAQQKDGDVRVYNTTTESFVEVTDIDSLKVISHFVSDEEFDMKRFLSELWQLQANQIQSQEKIIKRLKWLLQQKQKMESNKGTLFNGK